MNYRKIDISKDRELLLQFRKDVHSISFGDLNGFDEEVYFKRIEGRINTFPDGQLIIEENDMPIGQLGFFTMDYEGTEIGYVNLFYMMPEFRGKGLGVELMNYVEAYFRGAKVAEYHLRVSPTNQNALKLYRKMGMTKIKEEQVGHIVWRMKKTI